MLEQDRLLLLQSKETLEMKLKKIQHELCLELEGNGSYVDGSATPFLLEITLQTVHLRVASFTKLFVDVLKRSGGDHEMALIANYNGAYLTRHAHVTFMLKAWLNSVLFQNFENESFLSGGPTQFLNSNERKLKSFDYFQGVLRNADSISDYLKSDFAFAAFCSAKLLCFLGLWQSFRLFDINDFSFTSMENLEPGTRKLIEAFVSVAHAVWAIHKLCLSFEPCAGIFRVQPGSKLEADYMISVVSEEEDPHFASAVGFMICPGFRIRKSVVKCQIYLAGR